MSCEALGKMSTQTKSGHVPGLVTGNGGQTWGVTVSIELGNLPWQGGGGVRRAGSHCSSMSRPSYHLDEQVPTCTTGITTGR